MALSKPRIRATRLGPRVWVFALSANSHRVCITSRHMAELGKGTGFVGYFERYRRQCLTSACSEFDPIQLEIAAVLDTFIMAMFGVLPE